MEISCHTNLDDHKHEKFPTSPTTRLMKGGCGNKECAVSTGICGSTTFGSGELDAYGYWEHPCHKCARAFEKLHEEFKGRCWPFEEDKNNKKDED